MPKRFAIWLSHSTISGSDLINCATDGPSIATFGCGVLSSAETYSLGETLWFALTGKTPFAGHSVEEIHRAQQSNGLPIEQLKAAHVPSRLGSLLKSMLALEPTSRPGTHELAGRLQRCSPEARSARLTRVALAAAAILILGASALLVFQPTRIQNTPLNPAPQKSIAVLPLVNSTGDPANEYFSDGMC
jgi:serine/threonine protein kinase